MRSLFCSMLLISFFLFAVMQQPRTLEQEANGNTSAAGGGGHVSKLPLRSLLYPGATTRIYASLMPWFGDRRHIDVGYHSDDPQQIARQVTDMMSRGIDGAVVDWYGPDDNITSRTNELLLRESEARNFQFAILVNGKPFRTCMQRGCDVTALLLSELQYAEKHFEGSPVYIRWQGRPVVFFFDGNKFPIDWRRVRAVLSHSPLFVFRNTGAFDNPDSEGAFAWNAPEIANVGDPEALQYLERFYDRAKRSPGRFVMGSVYKGFDDSRASCGQGKRIPENCGQTWLDTFAEINRFYSASRQLPALLIVTWNDYEEGTAVEPGVGCLSSMTARLSGSLLTWDFKGNRNAVDRFLIFDSSDRQRLIKLGEVGAGQSSFDLRGTNLQPGDWLLVKAQAKAGMVDALSDPMKYGASNSGSGESNPR
jgi:hypothetical protein